MRIIRFSRGKCWESRVSSGLTDQRSSSGEGGRFARETGYGDVLPNVLPLPRKSSPKQDELWTNKMDYVTEI